MTKNIDELIADHETMSGLISSLIDYQERLNDYLSHNKKKEREREKIIDRINQITNNDPETLKRLIELTKLFVDGQLSYKNMKG